MNETAYEENVTIIAFLLVVMRGNEGKDKG